MLNDALHRLISRTTAPTTSREERAEHVQMLAQKITSLRDTLSILEKPPGR